MLTFGELALFLNSSAVRAHSQIKHETDRLVQDGAKISKGYIGQERDGWKPLSGATMDGFVHAYGFRIPGKTELGFTGQVSGTDPLLRTGALRESIAASTHTEGSHIVGTVGSPSKIAAYQELGTARALYPIPPRPFLGPGLQEAAEKHKSEFGHLAVSLLVPGIR